jgi:type III restriction enzyme
VREEASYSVADLVLDVPERVDPKRLDLDSYAGFLELLTQGRQFQEEAIRACLRFLAGGEFVSTRDLALHNYRKNPHLESAYGSEDRLVRSLPFPERLACSVDLATGTGKSYVIYAIARILLNEGLVDRVLTLCPSTTIEAGLLEKFRALSADRELREALPRRGGVRNPDIIQASSTIEPGKMCVENIHATYTGSKSAIADSLAGKGDRTLVLNDEAHHIFSPTDRDLKKWKGFLEDDLFGFRRIVGFSGTCYVANEYFSDVVFRYSLPQAIEDGTVKKVWYVDQDTSRTETDAFAKILANHESNRRKYRPLKPLTILVTKDIKAATALGDRLVNYLDAASKRTKKSASGRVLVVTSAREHVANVAKLRLVDSKTNRIEWIVSVSMLTEGWDVKNVLQIVPHEQRAFNSKLLIAQVLGRGLRIPQGLDGIQPEVTVFNHERWAPAIRHLVDEVMELDVRIASYPVSEREQFNFEVDQLILKAAERVETVSPRRSPVALPKTVALAPQADRSRQTTRYRSLTGSQEREFGVDVVHSMRPVPEVVDRIINKLKMIDMEQGTSYAKKVRRKELEGIIRRSLKRAGAADDFVSEENEQKILAAFGPLARRKTRQRPRLTVEVEGVQQLSTKAMPSRSIRVGSLKKEAGLFYDDTSLVCGEESDRRQITEIDDGHPYGGAVQRIPNPYSFKTPNNVVLATHRPEREFTKSLFKSENAKMIDAWVKSPDSHFYGIEFTFRKGEHQKQAIFNPDFLISLKKGKEILIIETKADGDVTEENQGKVKYAELHVAALNKHQKKRRYYFYFLSPRDYELFFQKVREGRYKSFQSELHIALKSNGSGETKGRTSGRSVKRKATRVQASSRLRPSVP